MVASKTQAQAPARSLDQRMEALKRANDIRVRRAQLKKDLKDGQVQIEETLLDPPEYVSTAKVFDMLMAVPKFGRVKAARLLNPCRISQSKTGVGLCARARSSSICSPTGDAPSGRIYPAAARVRMSRVFVVTGPSGAGKGTLIKARVERIPALARAV